MPEMIMGDNGMKKIFQINVLLVLALIMLSGQCKKQSETCHFHIKFKNNSGANIITAYRLTYAGTNGGCKLAGATLEAGASKEESARGCWEDRLAAGGTYELYIVDPAKFNGGSFYACEDIPVNNKVLKHYNLSLEELRSMDFTIVYE